MELYHHLNNSILIITPGIATLDAKNSAEFKQAVLDLINAGPANNIILDLNFLHFIDSSGLGSFLSILKAVNLKKGKLKLAKMNRPIVTLFELVSMNKNFEIFLTVEDAVHSFNTP